MNDTFDFTSYVRSGKLHEAIFNMPLNPRLVAALEPFSNSYMTVGSSDWDQMVDIVSKVTGMDDNDLTDFLGGDYGGPDLYDYAEALDIRIGYEDDFEEESPHQTSDTGSQPRGIGEVIKEILKSKFTKSI